MADDLISVIKVAEIHGKRKQTVFKLIKRLGIEQVKAIGEDARGQRISYITMSDYDLLKTEFSRAYQGPNGLPTADETPGVFYLIQLEPEHDSGRFKVGFATNIDERLRSHRTAAPLSRLIKTWPCKSLWERTAIDCVSVGCERLYTEVFRAPAIEDVVERCDRFFEIMPKPERTC